MELDNQYTRLSGLGHVLFGIAVAGLATLSLIYGNFAPILEPSPAFGRWAYGLGAILLAASAGLFFARTALPSAITIGVFESVWVVARVRPVLLKPLSVGSWYGVAEALGPLVATWILFALLSRRHGRPAAQSVTGDRAVHVAQLIFGAACLAYGAAHFAYATYTAAMVPAWLPGRRDLAYLTGVCHAAAGFGILVGVLPRLAATLEALMLSLFGVLVWLPSFFEQPVPEWASPTQVRWSETLLTILLAASAWIVAASLRNTRWGFAPNPPGDSVTPIK